MVVFEASVRGQHGGSWCGWPIQITNSGFIKNWCGQVKASGAGTYELTQSYYRVHVCGQSDI